MLLDARCSLTRPVGSLESRRVSPLPWRTIWKPRLDRWSRPSVAGGPGPRAMRRVSQNQEIQAIKTFRPTRADLGNRGRPNVHQHRPIPCRPSPIGSGTVLLPAPGSSVRHKSARTGSAARPRLMADTASCRVPRRHASDDVHTRGARRSPERNRRSDGPVSES